MGIGTGVAFALAWRPVHRVATRAINAWVGGIRSAVGRVLVGTVTFPVPFLLTPFGMVLLTLIEPRFGLAALIVAFGDSFRRMALGWPVGPGEDA